MNTLCLSDSIGGVIFSHSVRELITQRSLSLNGILEIDLTGCVWDYPSVGLLIDAILEKRSTETKLLTIKVEYLLEEEHLVRLIFLGSKALEVDEIGRQWYPGDITKRVSNVLEKLQFTILVKIIDPTDQAILAKRLYGYQPTPESR